MSVGELKTAADMAINSFAFRFDSAAKIAWERAVLDLFGFPDDYLEHFRGNISKVDEAQAQLAQANAAAKTANADVERFTPLIEKREISQQQYDQTLAAADTANAAVAAATAGVRRAEEQVRQAGEKIRQADAGLDTARATTMTVEATVARAKSSDAQAASAKAELQQAELNMSYTHILAPVDGIVGRRTAQVGQNVEPGQELLTITPTRGLWVTANFKETQLSRMRPNQPVEISVDGCGQSLNGHVTAIGGSQIGAAASD